jgi:mannose-6-phosphate isomerase
LCVERWTFAAIIMAASNLMAPLSFHPIFRERIWGGRRLESEFGKKLPPKVRIGESWEIVDRPEAQSVVVSGPLKGETLHEIWSKHRKEIFGDVPDGPSRTGSTRFPLLIKLLDAQEKLSLQVHPSERIAAKLGGEPKTECWYVAAADPNAEIFAGFRAPISREQFEKSLRAGSATDHVHTIRTNKGDAMFLPAGRFHAVGAGNLLVEIQQNSDTTYRVFDWGRIDANGQPRPLHVDQALQCIDFNDLEPNLIKPKGELLVRHHLFEIQKWNLDSPREGSATGQFAIFCCLTGSLNCAGVDLRPGEFFLVPASLPDRHLRPQGDETTLLRVTIPKLDSRG